MPSIPLLLCVLMSFCSSARGGRAEGRERRQVVDVAGDGGALVQRRVRVRPAPGRVGRRRQVCQE